MKSRWYVKKYLANFNPNLSTMPPNLEQASNVENKEVTPVEQQAIDEIKKSDGKAIDAKFPDPSKTNEELKKQENLNDISQNIDKIILWNINLIQDSDKLVDNLVNTNFKSIVAFLDYFAQSKTWFSLNIINSPVLAQNGRDNVSLSSLSDTNISQKQEIVKAFLAIPATILQTQISQFNLDGNRKSNFIDDAVLSSLIASSKTFQNIQSQITQNDINIKLYWDIPRNTSENIDITNQSKTQIIWELHELESSEQIKINNILKDIDGKYDEYKISSFQLLWYADATRVTDYGEEKVANTFDYHLNLLKSKMQQSGLNDSRLPPTDYKNFGQRLVDTGKIKAEDLNKPKTIANRAYATTRAIMQISWMDTPELTKLLSTATPSFDIQIDKEKWDDKTNWWILLNGIWTNKWEAQPHEFNLTNKSPEILLDAGLKIAIKIWDQIKIFRFEHQNTSNASGASNTVNTYAQMTDEWHYWTHGNEKTNLDGMKSNTDYSKADLWWPVFYMNIPDPSKVSPEYADLINKINNSNLQTPENIPSASDFLGLYNSLWWDQSKTEKFNALYNL